MSFEVCRVVGPPAETSKRLVLPLFAFGRKVFASLEASSGIWTISLIYPSLLFSLIDGLT